MTAPAPLAVVLCWHMHQPEYRDPVNAAFRAPWTCLHAIKDYTDMAFHLEHNPRAMAVVNFSAVLLEQLEDLAARTHGHLERGTAIGEPLLDALAQPVLIHEDHERRGLVAACLQAHQRHLIDRHGPYRRLASLARSVLQGTDGLQYLQDSFVTDLLVWYHLAWIGEGARRADPRVDQLMAQGHDYTFADRRRLLSIIAELLAGIGPRYQALARSGRVELSVSPWGHPILPLLLDFGSARVAAPALSLPAASRYPGGEARASWHLQQARMTFTRFFGIPPSGCWPSEGAVCARSLELIHDSGYDWAASGEAVLRRSLGETPPDHTHRYRPCSAPGCDLPVFFRDDRLSDLIGFTYKDWHGDDAVADLVRQLEEIAAAGSGPGRVVAIILDGENAWEHYPDNGYHFLSALYDRLGRHDRLELTTFSRYLQAMGTAPAPLPRLVPGSWVHGDLATWIGHPDKNLAWDMLVAAKNAFDRVPGAEEDERLTRQLAVCEGSDWFWWPGEYNPELAVARFERLYRLQLAGLYRYLGVDPPEMLARPFTRGTGHPEAGGTMRPSV